MDEAEICLNGTIRQARDGQDSLKKAWDAAQDEVNPINYFTVGAEEAW